MPNYVCNVGSKINDLKLFFDYIYNLWNNHKTKTSTSHQLRFQLCVY
jgi:hypothetical protein